MFLQTHTHTYTHTFSLRHIHKMIFFKITMVLEEISCTGFFSIFNDWNKILLIPGLSSVDE